MFTNQIKVALLSHRQILDEAKKLALRHSEEWDKGTYSQIEWEKILTNEAMNLGFSAVDAVYITKEALIYLGVNPSAIIGSSKKALDALNQEIDKGEHPDHRTPNEIEEYNPYYGVKGTEPEQNKFGKKADSLINVKRFAPHIKRQIERQFDSIPNRYSEEPWLFGRKRRERGKDSKSEIPIKSCDEEVLEKGWNKTYSTPEYSHYVNPNFPNFMLETTKWGYALFNKDPQQGGYVKLEEGDLNGLGGFLMGLSGKAASTKKAEVEIHETPKFLPPREDVRRHIDKDVKKELHDDLHQDDDIEKTTALKPSVRFLGSVEDFQKLWDNSTPRGRCRLLGVSGKPTSILFFRPWDELDEREKGLISRWLKKPHMASIGDEEPYWLDAIAEAEERAKDAFLKDPEMIELARMEGIDMDTLWMNEKEDYLKFFYDPLP